MGFTIKTIQGTGENAQYWRIADDLVRGSRLFRHLCLKIYRGAQKNGINVHHKNRFKAMYKDIMKEFKQFERDANAVLKKQDVKIKKQESIIANLKSKITADSLIIKDLKKKKAIVINTRKRVESKNLKVKAAESFFNKEFNWHGDALLDYRRAEIMLRGIIGFNELAISKETTYYQILFLSIGYQLDAFSKKQVFHRYGAQLSRHFTREVNRLIKLGYIRRFERKAYFYLTDEGKQKFIETMRKIYQIKMTGYWENIFVPKDK